MLIVHAHSPVVSPRIRLGIPEVACISCFGLGQFLGDSEGPRAVGRT
jgi:hypothetical protein